MTDKQKATCGVILKHYGIESQRRQLIEECAELIQAITKLESADKRDEWLKGEEQSEASKAEQHLYEELSDVEIMLEQVKEYYYLGNESIIEDKLNRQLERIKREAEKCSL